MWYNSVLEEKYALLLTVHRSFVTTCQGPKQAFPRLDFSLTMMETLVDLLKISSVKINAGIHREVKRVYITSMACTGYNLYQLPNCTCMEWQTVLVHVIEHSTLLKCVGFLSR